MHNNLSELKLKVKSFVQELYKHLSNNLDFELCQSVGSLLSIDYATRLKSSPSIENHINVCIKRLKNYLGLRVVLDNQFSEAMTLFVVAITPINKPIKDDQSQKILIDTITNQIFSDLSEEEQICVKYIIKDFLGKKDAKEIMDMIVSNPTILQKMIKNFTKSKLELKQISYIVNNHMMIILQQYKEARQVKKEVNNIAGKLLLACGISAVSSLGLFFGGISLPALIIPGMVTVVNIVPAIEKFLAKNIIDNSDYFKTKSFDKVEGLINKIQNNIIEYKKNKISNHKQFIKEHDINHSTLSPKQIKSLCKTMNIEPILTTTNHNLQTGKTNLTKKKSFYRSV